MNNQKKTVFANDTIRNILVCFIFSSIAIVAMAEGSVTVQFSEGSTPKNQRGGTDAVVFETVSGSRELTVANTLIVPGYASGTTRVGSDGKPLSDFAGSIAWTGGSILLDGSNQLDCETFYFMKDYNEEEESVLTADLSGGTLYAYTFTGWHITNSPLASAKIGNIRNNKIMPAQTVFQPGDVITPQVLQDFGIIDESGNPTGTTLTFEALWGRCYFAKDGGASSGNCNNYMMPGTFPRAATALSGTGNAYERAIVIVGDATHTALNDAKGKSVSVKSLQVTGTPTEGFTMSDGNRFTLISIGASTPSVTNARIDNVVSTYSTDLKSYYNPTNNSFIEYTARMTGFFGTYMGGHRTILYVFNGGEVKSAEWLDYNLFPSCNCVLYFGRNVTCSGVLDFGANGSNETSGGHSGDFNLFITGGQYSSYVTLTRRGQYTKDRHLYVYGDQSGSTEYDPSIPEVNASNLRPPDKDVYMEIKGCTNLVNVYCGGRTYTATVKGSTHLTIWDSAIQGNLNVGGRYGSFDGTANLDMKNSTIKGNLYGSGMGSTSITTSTSYFLAQTAIYTELLNNPPAGFPKYDKSSQSVLMYKRAEVGWWSYEGSGLYNQSVIDYTALLSTAYAGNTHLEIENSTIGTPGSSSGGNVYGGGADAWVKNGTTVILKNSTVYGSVYVTGSETRITGNVFGGGNQGDVTGSPVVTIGD